MSAKRKRARPRHWIAIALAATLAISLFGTAPAQAATDRTYSLDADFAEGILVGLNHDAPNSDQLQLNTTSSTFPFIWVANSGEGTISKLDTVTGVELGRYRTAPAGVGNNPSRTTVDLDGNVWVGNRNSNTITKVGLEEAGNCIDRNGNGVIDTSTGSGDVKAWSGATPADECILLHVVLNTAGGNNVRAVAIDANNNVFAGMSSGTSLYQVNGATGAIMQTFTNNGYINYGAVVDSDGALWVATLNSAVIKHTFDGAGNHIGGQTISLGRTSYGMGLDSLGNIWISNWTYNTVQKVRRSDGAILGTFATPGATCNRGVAVTADNNVWIAGSCTNSVARLQNSGASVTSYPVGSTPTGVAVDHDGRVWAANLGSHNTHRIDPVTGTVSGPFAVGNSPYNYSDMTGHIIRTLTTNTGTWTVIHDSGTAGTDWGTLSWNGATPAGTTITGRVRASDSVAGLGGNAYVGVGNGIGFAGLTGRYIQIEMTLQTTTPGITPVLYDVTIELEVACSPSPTLIWNAPLSPGTPYDLPSNGTLPIRFSYGTCAGFIHDESVIILIQDSANLDYPVTAYVHEWDIMIDDVAEEYQQDFDASWYWLAPGTQLQVMVFIGDEFVGEALVNVTTP